MTDFFHSDLPVYQAAAPGRMDVMGGISDYSGSLLLQMPIKQTTRVLVQQRNDGMIVIQSIESKRNTQTFSVQVSELLNKNYQQLSTFLYQQKNGDWAAYVIGCLVVLKSEKGIPLTPLSIAIESEVPVGKGVSSSAALEVATCCAIAKLNNLELSDTELPLLAQKAENLVVGAPCGLMDQLSSYLGHKNKLLPLVCQPHTVLPAISIPAGITFTAIDSGVRHAVSGASYGDVRTAAFMAYTMIALENGSSVKALREASAAFSWSSLPYGGFLANISPSLFQLKYANMLPEIMSGREFLEKYEVSIDTVTQIDPEKAYRLRACAEHPVNENFRISNFMHLLQNFSKVRDKEESLRLLGEMMFQSHSSYSSVGLGNKNTDEIVERVRQSGPSKGVYGARITGGGSGGTVCVLSHGKNGKQHAKKIFEEYRKEHHIKSFFFSGSSEGAKELNKR